MQKWSCDTFSTPPPPPWVSHIIWIAPLRFESTLTLQWDLDIRKNTGLDFLDNETPSIPDIICPVNETHNSGSRFPDNETPLYLYKTSTYYNYFTSSTVGRKTLLPGENFLKSYPSKLTNLLLKSFQNAESHSPCCVAVSSSSCVKISNFIPLLKSHSKSGKLSDWGQLFNL